MKKKSMFGKVITIPIVTKSFGCKREGTCSCDSQCRDCGSQVSKVKRKK